MKAGRGRVFQVEEVMRTFSRKPAVLEGTRLQAVCCPRNLLFCRGHDPQIPVHHPAAGKRGPRRGPGALVMTISITISVDGSGAG